MKTFKKYKKIIIAVLALIAVLFVYNSFFKKAPQAELPGESANVGADIVELFASLERVVLDRDLFNSPLYRSLMDWSINIPPQPVGRLNPFESIGRD